MKTSADMIAQAKAAQKAKEGVRVKVRFPNALVQRARECANQVDDDLGDWVNIACRRYLSDAITCVATLEEYKLATRGDSVPVTIKAPLGMTCAEIKSAVLYACIFCEQRAIPCTPQPCAEYKVEEPFQ